MNSKYLFKIFKWPYAKYLFALIVIVVLLLIVLMSCKTQQSVSESRKDYHRQQTLTAIDSTYRHDMSVISDTRYAIMNETLWREPDSLGNIYPLITTNTQLSTQNHRQNNITSVKIDSLTMTDDTDYDLTATEQTVIANPSSLIPNQNNIPNRLSLIITVIVIVIVIVFIILKT